MGWSLPSIIPTTLLFVQWIILEASGQPLQKGWGLLVASPIHRRKLDMVSWPRPMPWPPHSLPPHSLSTLPRSSCKWRCNIGPWEGGSPCPQVPGFIVLFRSSVSQMARQGSTHDRSPVVALVSRGTVAHGKGPSAQESPKKIINMNQFFEAPPLKTNYDLSITLEKSRNIDPNHDFCFGGTRFFM